MAVVLIRCEAPMQSWGTRSRFAQRDTERIPTKSGIIGLMAAALGRSRSVPIDDLAVLSVSVRIDRAGRVENDYHTTLDVARADGSGTETAVSNRAYLADSSFLVAVEGDAQVLQPVIEAIAKPRWPLFLGRRGFVPGSPLLPSTRLFDAPAVDVLSAEVWPQDAERLVAWIECGGVAEGGVAIRDVPLSFAVIDRRYGVRYIKRVSLERSEASS